MKKIILRSGVYLLLLIICTTLGIIGYLNKPTDIPDSKILNTTYYKYNVNTNNYEEIKITTKTIDYKGELLNISSCKDYIYTEITGIIKLTDCNKAFRIVGFTEDAIVLNIEGDNHYFYKDKEKSFNGEFQRNYQMSIEAYRLQGEEKLKDLEITAEELKELIDNKDTSFIYLKGLNCKNECTFFNNEFTNFSSEDNIYYLNASKITMEEIQDLVSDYKDFPNTYSEYNTSYPQVFVVGNKTLIEKIKIEGKGFDYSEYANFADNFEVSNENNE